MTTLPADESSKTATFRLEWRGQEMEAQARVPTAPVRTRVLLPMIQQLASAVVALCIVVYKSLANE